MTGAAVSCRPGDRLRIAVPTFAWPPPPGRLTRRVTRRITRQLTHGRQCRGQGLDRQPTPPLLTQVGQLQVVHAHAQPLQQGIPGRVRQLLRSLRPGLWHMAGQARRVRIAAFSERQPGQQGQPQRGAVRARHESGIGRRQQFQHRAGLTHPPFGQQHRRAAGAQAMADGAVHRTGLPLTHQDGRARQGPAMGHQERDQPFQIVHQPGRGADVPRQPQGGTQRLVGFDRLPFQPPHMGAGDQAQQLQSLRMRSLADAGQRGHLAHRVAQGGTADFAVAQHLSAQGPVADGRIVRRAGCPQPAPEPHARAGRVLRQHQAGVIDAEAGQGLGGQVVRQLSFKSGMPPAGFVPQAQQLEQRQRMGQQAKPHDRRMLDAPVQRGADIAKFRRELAHPALVRHHLEGTGRTLEQLMHGVGMHVSRQMHFPVFLQLQQAVGPHTFQQLITRPVIAVHLDQGMVHQPFQRLGHGPGIQRPVRQRRSGHLQREAAFKRFQPTQHQPLDLTEQRMAVVHAGPQGLVPARPCLGAACQQAVSVIEAFAEGVQAEGRETPRRQLQRQRMAIKPAAQHRHLIEVVRSQCKRQPLGPHTIHKQRHRPVPQRFIDTAPLRRRRQRGRAQHALARHAQHAAAGHHQRHVFGALDQRVAEGRHPVRLAFGVVQHQQQRHRPQHFEQGAQRRGRVQPQGDSHRAGRLLRQAALQQIDPHRTIPAGLAAFMRTGQRERRLADAWRADNCDQPMPHQAAQQALQIVIAALHRDGQRRQRLEPHGGHRRRRRGDGHGHGRAIVRRASTRPGVFHQRQRKAIALPRHRHDGFATQHAPQGGHMHGRIVLFHDLPRPHSAQQIILGHHRAPLRHQRGEQVDLPAAQRHGHPVGEQGPRGQVQYESFEAISTRHF